MTKKFALCVVFAMTALSSVAQPVEQARKALQQSDAPTALRILEDAVGKGDLKAKGQLSTLLLNLPPPFKNAARGCALAGEGGRDGDSMALATHAQCLLMGLIPSAQPHAEAREMARRSSQLGDPAGAFIFFLAFSTDPKNSYFREGKADMAAYNALAARAIGDRADQIEAIDSLAFATRNGHVNAALVLATYFYETSAPENVARLRGLTNLLLKNGERSPVLAKYLQQVTLIEKLGITKASAKTFFDTYQMAMTAASLAYMAQNNKDQCPQLQLKTVTAGEVRDALFLPVKFKEIENSYLVNGTWSESWTFHGCGKDVPVNVAFTADGWGGAKFTARSGKTQ